MTELELPAAYSAAWKRNARKWARWVSFCLGLVVLGAVLHSAWTGTYAYLERVVIGSFQRQIAQQYRFGCLTPECDRCLAQIDEFPDGIVITGASGAIYAIDLGVLSSISSRPLINCMMFGVQLEEYLNLLNVVNRLKPQQTIIHAINSWIAVAPVPARSRLLDDMRRGDAGQTSPARGTLEQAREIARLINVYLVRHQRELQIRWRGMLRLANPGLAEAIELFPLRLERHLRGKEDLMRRWIGISPWTTRFIPRGHEAPAYGAARNRIVALRSHFEPAGRQVFLRLPEYTAITNTRREELFRQANDVFRRAVADVGDSYVDVDYAACGLNPKDFWKGLSEGGSYGIDPTHLNHGSKARITACMVKELRAHDLFR